MVGDPDVATSITCSLTATNCVLLTKQHNLREDESTSSEEDSGTVRYSLPLVATTLRAVATLFTSRT